MIPKTGKAIIHVRGVGVLRLDDGGLNIVQADLVDPKTHPKLVAIVNNAFAIVDGVHVTTAEALERLPEAFGLPASAMTLIELYGEESVEPSTDDLKF